MKDLLGHLRDLYVVKHTVQTLPSIALSEEQLDALRSQGNRVSTARTITFVDLIGEALRAVRQGSDARLELELALIKMTAFGPGGVSTRPEGESAAPFLTSMEAGDSAIRNTTQFAPDASRQVSAGIAPSITDGDDASVAAPPHITENDPQHPAAQNEAFGAVVQPDIEHLRRAWPVVLEAVKKRQAGLFAVLAEGRPETLEGNELVVKFPAGHRFQADQVGRGENPRVIAAALAEITGKELRIIPRVAAEPPVREAEKEEDARILSKDELIRVLRQEFDAQFIDDGPAR